MILTSLLFFFLCRRLGHADVFNLIKKHKLYEASLRHLMELLQLDELVGAHTCTQHSWHALYGNRDPFTILCRTGLCGIQFAGYLKEARTC